jgi:hypothetical protein
MVTSYSGLNLNESYYKCDGFKGLLKCLNDIIELILFLSTLQL